MTSEFNAPGGAGRETTDQDVAAHAERWSTLYAYHHGTSTEVSSFITEVVAPAARAIVAEERAADWHYLRYWTGGPHVRVRLRDAVPGAADELAVTLRNALASRPQPEGYTPEQFYARFPQADVSHWMTHGEVVRAAYEPEVRRYGGMDALQLAEEFFGTSSELAAAVLRSAGSPESLVVIAGDLMASALHAIGLPAVDMISQARAYHFSWDRSEEVDSEGATARAAAEDAYWKDPSRWDARIGRIVEISGGEPTIYSAWAESVRRLATSLEERDRAGALEAPPQSIIWSLIHMMNNRMGVSVWQEQFISWLAAMALSRHVGVENYFDPDVRAADREFLLASRYMRHGASADDQGPRDVSHLASRPVLAVESIETAPSGELPEASLLNALQGRRTHYGDYGTVLDLAPLAQALQLAVGHPDLKKAVADRGYHPIPRAGALGSVETYIVARNVSGLPVGTYRYRPESGVMDRVDGRGWPTLCEAVPAIGQIGVDPLAAIEDTTVPVVVVLVADTRRLRERYGLRALRLSLLEAGHVAQNLELCATALGLKHAHLSGFVDDGVNARLMLDGLTRFALAVIPIGASQDAHRQ